MRATGCAHGTLWLPSPPHRSLGKCFHFLLTLQRTMWGRGAGGEGALLAAPPLDRILNSFTRCERISQYLIPRNSQRFLSETAEVTISSLISLPALVLASLNCLPASKLTGAGRWP